MIMMMISSSEQMKHTHSAPKMYIDSTCTDPRSQSAMGFIV